LKVPSFKSALSLKGNSNKTLLTYGAIALAGLGALYLLNQNGGLGSLFNPNARANAAMGYPGGAPAPSLFQMRSFPDYTFNENQLPTPWVEVNVPYDNTDSGARLANIIDKAAYIQTYDGQGAFGHIGL